MMVWTRVAGLAMLAMVTACARAEAPGAACQRALKDKLPDAVAPCRRAYAVDPTPAVGARLAAAEAIAGNTAAIESLAARIGDHPDGARVWHLLGQQRRNVADTPGAIAAFERALAHRAAGDVQGRVDDLAALYERLSHQNDYRKMLEYGAEAYELSSGLSDPHERRFVLTGVIGILLEIGDLAGAERLLEEATPLPGDPYAAFLLQYRALVDHLRGRDRLARQQILDALAMSPSDPHLVRDLQLNLIDVHLALGDTAAASALVEADVLPATPSPNRVGSHAHYAAMVAEAGGDPAGVVQIVDEALTRGVGAGWDWQLVASRGRALERLDRIDEARDALERAIGGVEVERAALGFDELKAWLLRERRRPYEDLFLLEARAGRATAALAVTQRATARSFLDGLVRTPDATPTGALEVARHAQVRADALLAVATSLRASPAATPMAPAQLLTALAGRAVLQYFEAGDELWLIAIRDGGVTLHRCGAVAELEPLVAAADRLEPDALAALATAILPAELVPEGGLVHVAPDGVVASVPFAALIVDGRALIERIDLAYAPSATVLAMLAPRLDAGEGMVVVGDPTTDLPGARAEATEVASLFGVTARLGAEASAEVVHAARQVHLLHVAAHADATPGGVALRLADRMLPVQEVLDAAIAPDVVVLASCSSSAPEADPWGALAGSFLAAGSRDVVASRWALDDQASRAMMRSFYQEDGVDRPARALAAVQRSAIAAGVPARIWAGLVVIGRGVSPNAEEHSRGGP